MNTLLVLSSLVLAGWMAVPHTETPEVPPGLSVSRDVVYVELETGALALDVYVPEVEEGVEDNAPPPLVVWIHGGAWKLGDKGTWVHPLFLLEHGYAVASVQYRFSQTATFPAQIEDCRAALRYLREHADELGVDARRVGVMGESAGGMLAALLATTADEHDGEVRPAAVIELFGPMDLTRHVEQSRQPGRQATTSVQELVGGDPTADEAARKLARAGSPILHVGANDPPMMVVHGTADPLVHLDQSRDFVAAVRAAGATAELVEVDGAGHASEAFWTPALEQRYAAFLDRHLRDDSSDD